jgi:hypothetical protein
MDIQILGAGVQGGLDLISLHSGWWLLLVIVSVVTRLRLLLVVSYLLGGPHTITRVGCG